MFFLQKQRYAISVSELLRLKDEKIRGLRTEMKQNKEIFASTILNQEKNLRLEENNSQDICYILDKMNKFDRSLKEHDVKGIIKHTSV